MKVLFIFLFYIGIPGFAPAEIVTNVNLTSNYIWRGQSQSNNDSAVQGTFEINKENLSLGTWLSSLGGQVNGTEVDIYAYYKLSLSDPIDLRLGVTNYTYTGNHGVDTLEYFVALDWDVINLFVGATGKYFGKETASIYYNLNRSFESVIPKLSLNIALGYTTFEDESVSGSKNIMDYKLGISKNVNNFNYELFFTDTNRRILINSVETEVDDVAVGINFTVR